MPLYEFKCSECEHVFEKLQNRNADAPSPCPSCGKEGSISRLISNTSFQLKGGGWYADGYGSGGGSTSSTTSANDTSTASESSTSSSSGEGSTSGSSTPGSDSAAS